MARPKKVNENAEYLTYALLHLERERDVILAKIAGIQKQLGTAPAKATPAPAAVPVAAPVVAKKRGRPAKNAVAAAPVAAPAEAKVRKTRELSPAARKRISLAQKKRWAAARGANSE